MRKLADYLSSLAARPIAIGRERLRLLLVKHGITFQRTKTWKESNDPQRDAKLARIDYVTSNFPQKGVRVRRVRASRYPPAGRFRLGTQGASTSATRELSQAARRPAVPRLLQRR